MDRAGVRVSAPVRLCDSQRMTKLLEAADIVALSEAWRSRRPESRPVGSELRASERSTWVRFHSLPGSKRYPDDQFEYDELLARHFTLLTELDALAGTATSHNLRAVTVAWSKSSRVAERDRHLRRAFPAATYWQPVAYDVSDPDDQTWIHLYVGATALASAELRALLLLAADDRTREVVICPPGFEWLYHPYDGGGDAIAHDIVGRDLLANRHASWLPEKRGRPLGAIGRAILCRRRAQSCDLHPDSARSGGPGRSST